MSFQKCADYMESEDRKVSDMVYPKAKPVHWCGPIKPGQKGYAACSGWYNVPYTLLKSSVTCKSCRRMKEFKKLL